MADSNKTEQPTQKRLEKARKEGRYPASRHFVSGVQFLAFVWLLSAYGGLWLEELKQSAAAALRGAASFQISPGTVTNTAWRIAGDALLLPFAAGGIMVASMLAVQLATTRLGISLQRLTPDVKRLNPVSRIQETWRNNVPAFLQAVLLIPLFSALVYWVVASDMEGYFRLPLQSLEEGLRQIAGRIDGLLWKAALSLATLGAIDLFRQHRRYTRDLRMSKQEVRDELKESEGNPEIKGRVRRIQRDRARRRMMQEIPTATAVVVNPTHYAVAIRYDLQALAAPMVVAKGKNYLALRIRQRAAEHLVPIIENPPLARALYGSVDVGQEIPPHLYRAVAEVLAYVYRLMQKN
jgi:flagellar biosynthetic protein FlhB